MVAPLLNSTAEGFGFSVSVKGDTTVVGDVAHGDLRGGVFVYEFDATSNSWNQLGDTIVNDGCAKWFGFVRLTHDEGLVISCGGWSGIIGEVYYYEKLGGAYMVQQTITDFDYGLGSVSVDGNVMVASEDREMICPMSSISLFEKIMFGKRSAESTNRPLKLRLLVKLLCLEI